MDCGLKHVLFKLRCLWHGHETVLGTAYSVALGRRVERMVCKHCHKVF